MKLGAIAVDDAVRAVLDRAVRVEDERVGVGHRLSADDVKALRAGGVGSVVTGRLDPGDVEREEAARRIAKAVAGEGVRVEPGEGRYDLFAEATTHRVSVAPLVQRRAGLVLTGSAGEDLDATAATEGARLSALGSSVVQAIRCDHEMGPVAEAIRTLVDAGLHPILVASSMPIVDRDDVVASALEETGGLVEHFGVPAHRRPALMLGRHGKTVVLGVPYPATADGAYQDVLQRIVAGLPVISELVMRIGCGGLCNRDES